MLAMCVQRTTAARTCNHSCSGMAVLHILIVCVFVALGIQYAMLMCPIILPSVACLSPPCIPHISYKERFSKENCWTKMCVLKWWNKSNKMQQLRFLFAMTLLYMFRVTISPIIRSTMLYMSPETCRVKPLRIKNAIVASCWTYFNTIKHDARKHKY